MLLTMRKRRPSEKGAWGPAPEASAVRGGTLAAAVRCIDKVKRSSRCLHLRNSRRNSGTR